MCLTQLSSYIIISLWSWSTDSELKLIYIDNISINILKIALVLLQQGHLKTKQQCANWPKIMRLRLVNNLIVNRINHNSTQLSSVNIQGLSLNQRSNSPINSCFQRICMFNIKHKSGETLALYAADTAALLYVFNRFETSA